MNPEDDPEARIRELERPFSDIARTSELGVGQYGAGHPPPPPYPPPPQGWYGGPQFPTPQAPKRHGAWLLAGVIAVGLIGLAVGVAVYAADDFTDGVAVTNPTRAVGGGGSFDTIPNTPDTPDVIGVEPAPTAEPDVPPASGAQVSISGIDENRTLACNDNVVSISGVSNTVTITGHCASVQVSGMSNVVTVDSAATISASGFENRVTFRSGDPQIGNSGSDNVVERG